ncbi:formate C-acetyltransferase [Treponema phagedenis F0421]|nr:formate C-acetyltransferase [Treponema phagedenis F0421]
MKECIMHSSDYWKSFLGESWRSSIDVRDFIQSNYTPYTGDGNFLVSSTERTLNIWNKLTEMFKEETKRGVYDAETKYPQGIDTYGPGYISKEDEVIVGLQADAPLKRGIFPKGGLRMVENSLEAYGYKLDPVTKEIFTKYRKTHNEGVFSAYTDEMKAARRAGIITGLPDAYGRGRIIGDYRRVPLYGVDYLIEERKQALKQLNVAEFTEDDIRYREEISEQIKALEAFLTMCDSYGYDVRRPAENAREAVQWLYFAFLAATKDQDGAAMSLGRTSTFLDIFIEKDIREGRLTEEEAQELIDQFIIKLRIIRFLRTPDYNNLFSGDPTWVTESIGGMGVDGRTLVTKTSYRYLHTLYNLGPAPEPNMTVLWSNNAPENWIKFCAKVSIETSSIQYENDDLMRPDFGDDYGIACCVSPMKIGKQMQLFGARANLPKCLLYAINGGKDEKSGAQVGPAFRPITSEYLDFDEVMERFENMMEWLAGVYINALKIIHYMHDKYSYEAFELALHDPDVERIQATGIAGLSIVADSLAAIRDAKVKVIRNEEGIAVGFEREGDYVPFGNDNDRTDELAVMVARKFMNYLRRHETYRHAKATQSVLTITSNVVYGKKTGATPCGRCAAEPFAPGANPMNGRDTNGAIASLASVAKLPFEDIGDGISYTFAIAPNALGKEEDSRINNLAGLMRGYFEPDGGQHLNVNVFNRELLEDAMEHPEKYPQLTIRVSGYAVNFVKLTREQQLDVLSRTINQAM